MRCQPAQGCAGGFTLIEVLVALVIVAFGMGAVLAALSASALNVSALREKTLAQWIALNRVADVRLNLQPPQTGTTEGDVKGFGNADWHWQQIVSAVQEIPGLLQITVQVRRNPGSTPGSSTSSGASGGTRGADKSGKPPDWTATVIGFRGDALAVASGETPDWVGTGFGNSGGASSSSGGTIPNPGAGLPGTTATPGSTGPAPRAPAPVNPGASSSGGP